MVYRNQRWPSRPASVATLQEQQSASHSFYKYILSMAMLSKNNVSTKMEIEDLRESEKKSFEFVKGNQIKYFVLKPEHR
jgi:hypothetical protein